MRCKACGANLDLTMGECPACGAEVELGRLTGILGIVCRACDAYNEPGARTCAACGKPLGGAEPAAAPPPPAPSPAPTATAAAPAPPRAADPPPATAAAPQPAAATAPRPASGPPPPPPPPAGAPVVRSFPKATAGAATRFVPSVLRPSAAKGEPPAVTPIPLVPACPRCGAEVGAGRFCARCGQPLGTKGTQVMAIPPLPARTAAQASASLAPGRAKLVLEAGEGVEAATFRLTAETIEAGRAKGAVVFPEDPCLAAHHATFLYRAGSLLVRDEGAPGGVFLRLRGISVPLRPGDHFAVGDRLLRYAGLLPAPPAPPPDGTRRLGAPRPAAPAVVLEEWLEGGAGGRAFVRGGPAVTIGRAGCSVNLGDDPHLSQAHAEILVDASGNARLKDLGSSSGTYVKLPPHGERELHDGDHVRIGREVLRVALA